MTRALLSSHIGKFMIYERHSIYSGLMAIFLVFSPCSLVLAAPQNTVDNAAQIDTREELQEAKENPNELSSDDLARELNNPNTPVAKLTIEFTTTSFEGDTQGAEGENVNLVLFKPVFPFPLNDDGTKNLFVRPVLAYATEQPQFNSNTGRFETISGFADMGFDIALGQSYDSGLILIGGIQGTLPTGADRLTSDQYRLGPEFIVADINTSRVIAAFPSHQWDVSGDGPSYSTTTLELFALKFLGGGWTVGTQPKLSYDWKNNQATIPLNITARKVVRLGKTPLQLSAGFDYFIEKDDDFGPDFGFKFSVTPVVPNFIYDWIQ